MLCCVVCGISACPSLILGLRSTRPEGRGEGELIERDSKGKAAVSRLAPAGPRLCGTVGPLKVVARRKKLAQLAASNKASTKT